MGRFLLVESCCYVVSELVKCCSRRVFRFEAVLVVDRRLRFCLIYDGIIVCFFSL